MHLSKVKSVCATVLSAAFLLCTVMPISVQAETKTITSNDTGTIDGFNYELWKDNGTTSMTLNGGGTFNCEWSNINNSLFRTGKKFDETQTHEQMGNISLDYACDYNPSGNSYLAVYGWTSTPLVEYYIVDSWGSWRPPGATSKGTITVDGGTYDVYETTRTDQPSIKGTATFQQYWSVRTSKRTSGKISVSDHFKAWEKMGMKLGKMYEVSLVVEGYQSSGKANVTKMSLDIGGAIDHDTLKGDVNDDGKVDVFDATLVKAVILKKKDKSSLKKPENADMDGKDGITALDYLLIKKKAKDGDNHDKPNPDTTKIKGSEVLVIGDSFLALSRDIKKDLEEHARTAGIMDANDSFKDNSVSGTKLAESQPSPSIPTQYQNGVSSGHIKYVIMDGGGNDCAWGAGGDAAVTNSVNALKTLFAQMKKDGIEKVFYVFYPDPVNNSTLKGRLDVFRPQVVNLINQSSSPKGYIIDLRPTFEGKYGQYILSDGIHPTAAGSKAAADAVWDQMQKINFFGSN